jgi:tRNA threonylcarbamoyladenosine biosynthesis protein TsaE
MRIITTTPEETFACAEKYAARLRGGEIIGLVGDLGAGKTVFAKGLAAGLGIKQTITSPTFVLLKIYPAGKKSPRIKLLCHIDAYRLRNTGDVLAIGAEEYFRRPDTVTVIEWADKIAGVLPPKTKMIRFQTKENARVLNFG